MNGPSAPASVAKEGAALVCPAKVDLVTLETEVLKSFLLVRWRRDDGWPPIHAKGASILGVITAGATRPERATSQARAPSQRIFESASSAGPGLPCGEATRAEQWRCCVFAKQPPRLSSQLWRQSSQLWQPPLHIAGRGVVLSAPVEDLRCHEVGRVPRQGVSRTAARAVVFSRRKLRENEVDPIPPVQCAVIIHEATLKPLCSKTPIELQVSDKEPAHCLSVQMMDVPGLAKLQHGGINEWIPRRAVGPHAQLLPVPAPCPQPRVRATKDVVVVLATPLGWLSMTTRDRSAAHRPIEVEHARPPRVVDNEAVEVTPHQ
mmetsp:Transcript_31816/g.69606  ORF Transcript_31816/g.69606 Transcript_31816/m.69606 type:complete len:319 (-) Transcript_31816:1158-2114(-)